MPATPSSSLWGPVRRPVARSSDRASAWLPPPARSRSARVDKLVQMLVFGCAYHRIAGATVPATTLRRCRDERWLPRPTDTMRPCWSRCWTPWTWPTIRWRSISIAATILGGRAPCWRPAAWGRRLRGEASQHLSPRGSAGWSSAQAWTNAHKKLVWCTKRRATVIGFWISLSTAINVERLVRNGWPRSRWATRLPRRL